MHWLTSGERFRLWVGLTTLEKLNEKYSHEPQQLWQHEETGRLVWHEKPGPRWRRIPTIHEDELPNDLTDDEYEWWFKNSHVPDGVSCRMGPLLRQPNIKLTGG